jgi:hypothetical protein
MQPYSVRRFTLRRRTRLPARIIMMERQLPVLCPSARCKDGAIVLGIILPDQTVAYADRRYQIDSHEADEMRRATISAEKQFRFAGPCAQCGCVQWNHGKCGVIEEAIDTPGPRPIPSALPECSIRPQCRWFLQRGEEACLICPLVVTDTSPLACGETI